MQTAKALNLLTSSVFPDKYYVEQGFPSRGYDTSNTILPILIKDFSNNKSVNTFFIISLNNNLQCRSYDIKVISMGSMNFFLFSFYSQGPLRIGSRPTNSLNPVIKPVHFSSGVVKHGTVFAKKSVYSLMLVTDRPSGAPLAARAPPPRPPRSPPPALRPRPRPRRPAAAPANPLHIDYITLKLSLVQSVTLLSEYNIILSIATAYLLLLLIVGVV